jgi:AraC-like DNA-binding protein
VNAHLTTPPASNWELRYEPVPLTRRESCRVQTIDVPTLPLVWHYHPEYELILITGGKGHRFVGESLDRYEPPDLALLGPNLPHTWASDSSAAPGPQRAIVVQFPPDFLGPAFFDRPEVAHIAALLRRSASGLRFPLEDAAPVLRRIKSLGRRQGLPRLLTLLEVLDQLATRDGAVPLSQGWTHPRHGGRRLEAALRILHDRFSEELRLADAARAANLSQPAFSRLFHASMGRTFSDYLTDLRVSAAQRMLVATDLPIATVAAHAGFANLSNFNRRFRERTGCTPTVFRQTRSG